MYTRLAPTHYIAKDDPQLLIFLPLAPNTEIIDILSLGICLLILRQGLTIWPILELRILLPQPAQHWEYKKAPYTQYPVILANKTKRLQR